MAKRFTQKTANIVGASVGLVAVIASVVAVTVGGIVGWIFVIGAFIFTGASAMIARAIHRDRQRELS